MKRRIFHEILILSILIVILLPLSLRQYFDRDIAKPQRDKIVKQMVSPSHPNHFFEEELFYSVLKNQKQNCDVKNIKGGVVPHHLVASPLLADFFACLKNQEVTTIILAGPNHHETGDDNILTSTYSWQTHFGKLKANKTIINNLVEEGEIFIDNSVLAQEHSIGGLTNFIKYYLPEIEIVPLIFKKNTSEEEVNRLVNLINPYLTQEGTVLVSSIDFSHYLTLEEANKKDQETLEVISDFNYEDLYSFSNDNLDSPASMALLLRNMQMLGVFDFSILAHSNSSLVLAEEGNETTSYFVLAFEFSPQELKNNQPDEENKISIQLSFVGDVMLDRYVRQIAQEKGYDFIFEKIKNLLQKESDLVVANLEGSITDKPSVSIYTLEGDGGHFTFTFDPQVVPVLKRNNIALVNLGNNHILNKGESGYKETKKYLNRGGIEFFGDIKLEEKPYWIKNIKGVDIAFVSYNQFLGHSPEQIVTYIQEVKTESDLVFVYTHWDREYVAEPLVETKKIAYQFVDAGADLIIGSHPHVVQSKEDYKGKRIYYSLGNFVFDQYFSQETQTGLLIKVRINPNDLSLQFEEVEVFLKNNGQVVKKSNNE